MKKLLHVSFLNVLCFEESILSPFEVEEGGE